MHAASFSDRNAIKRDSEGVTSKRSPILEVVDVMIMISQWWMKNNARDTLSTWGGAVVGPTRGWTRMHVSTWLPSAGGGLKIERERESLPRRGPEKNNARTTRPPGFHANYGSTLLVRVRSWLRHCHDRGGTVQPSPCLYRELKPDRDDLVQHFRTIFSKRHVLIYNFQNRPIFILISKIDPV